MLFIIIYVVVAVIASISLVFSNDEVFTDLKTPAAIHENFTFNWFGCIVSYLFLIIVAPFVYIPYLVYRFINFIFTVGRKD